MKFIPILTSIIITMIASCTTSVINFPETMTKLDENSYSLVIRESPAQDDTKFIMGPYSTVVSNFSLSIEDGDEIYFPNNSFEDLGDLHSKSAKVSYSAKDQLHILSIPGGDGGESYHVHYGISSTDLIWRRVGWSCPDNRGYLLKTCYKDTEFNQKKSE